MKTYIYKGDGAGIPGLAHKITETEAAELSTGLAQALKEAVASGSYIVEGEEKTPRPIKSKAGDTPEGE